MNKKIGVVLIVLIICAIFFSINGIAQETPISPEIEGEAGKITNATEKLQNFTEAFTEENRWEYLGGEWRKALLKNKIIGRFDAAFTRINFVFVILFARDYSLSLTLIFVFLLWLFTALSIEGYLIIIENKSYRALAAFAITIALAHMQVFNYIAKGAFKIIFYRSEWWWSLLSAVIVFVAAFLYLYINKIFAAKIKKGHEEARKKHFEHKTKELESFQKGVGEGL